MTYYGRPILKVRPNFDQLDHGQLDDFVFDTQGRGLAVPWKPTTALRRVVKLPFIFADRRESKEFRVFWESMRGPGDRFWLPLYVNEMPMVEDVLSGHTQVRVTKCGATERFNLGLAQFQHVALVTRDTLSTHGLVNVQDEGATELLTFAEPVPESFMASKTVLCPLLLCRFHGRAEYRYETDSVCLAEATFLESSDYPVPGEAWTYLGSTRPVFLYRFTRGASVTRFANYGTSITVGGATWQAGSITHGEVKDSTTFLEEGLELSVATDDPNHPLRYFIDPASFETMELEVFEADAEGLTVDYGKPVYAGNIEAVNFGDEGAITVALSSVLRYGETEALTMSFQRVCNHSLGDELCGLSLDALKTTGTLSFVDSLGRFVEATALATAVGVHGGDINWFALGRIVVGGETRFITGTTQDDRAYLNAPFSAGVAIVGAAFTAYPGDDKRINTCQTKFSNLEQNLSFPYMPNKNPQFKSIANPQPTGGKK